MNTSIPEPLALSVREAARRAGVSRSLIYSEMARGTLKTRRVAGRRLVLLVDLLAWLRGDKRDAA